MSFGLHSTGKANQNSPDNDKFRDECLDEDVFATMAEARAVIGRWRYDLQPRPTGCAYGGLAPATARLNSCTAWPLQPEPQISYEACGFP
jgi:putative transposase